MMCTTRTTVLAIVATSLMILWAGCNFKNSTVRERDSLSTMTGPITYLALGDSTGAGVGAREGGYVTRLFRRLETRRPGSTLTNLCVSGATTEDVLAGQLERGIAQQPTLVTLGIGINDIGHGLTLEQFSKNYDEILGKIRSETAAAVVVTNIPDISSAPRIPYEMRDQYQQLIIEFNRRLEEIASSHGVTVFDVYAITHEQLPSHPEFFSADGFHPSDAGYEMWAEQMWPTIARIIGADPGPG